MSMYASKTLFVVAFATLVFACAADAQPYIAPKFGINGLASFSESDGLQFKTDRGYQFGAEIGTRFQDVIGVRAELMYANIRFSQSEERIQQEGSGPERLFTESVDVRNGTLTASGAVLLTLGNGFEVSLGPQFDLLLSSVADGTWNFSAQDSILPVDYDYLDDPAGEGAYWNFDQKNGNYFNSLNLGINLGLGLNVIGNLFIDLRTNYAVTDLVNDFYLEGSAKETRRFDVIINASYRIPLRRQKQPDVMPDLPFEQ